MVLRARPSWDVGTVVAHNTWQCSRAAALRLVRHFRVREPGVRPRSRQDHARTRPHGGFLNCAQALATLAPRTIDVAGQHVTDLQLQALAQSLQLWPAVSSLNIKSTSVSSNVRCLRAAVRSNAPRLTLATLTACSVVCLGQAVRSVVHTMHRQFINSHGAVHCECGTLMVDAKLLAELRGTVVSCDGCGAELQVRRCRLAWPRLAARAYAVFPGACRRSRVCGWATTARNCCHASRQTWRTLTPRYSMS